MPLLHSALTARLVCLSIAMAVPASAQQLLNQDHPGQYSQEDIATGNRIYAAQCNLCHGRDGDQVSGVDLRRGVFRRSSTDEDLARVITNGTAAGMPPFRLQPSELTGIVAFIRAQLRYDGGRPGGRCRSWTRHLRGQGHVQHLPSRERARTASGARPERHRGRACAGRARAIHPRSLVGADADQSAGDDRD